MKKNILILVLLVIIGVLGYMLSVDKKVVMPIEDEVELAQYEDLRYDFSFKYPAEMVQGNGKIFLPGPAPEAVPSITFTRVLNVPHPLMSGEIEPTTDNPKVSVAVLSGFIDDIAKDFADYEKIDSHMSFGGRGLVIFRAGVEGEGVFYYLIPIDKGNTLLLMRNFIDENVVLNYQNVPGYLTLSQQEKYFQDILETLKIE